jgi:hypothetical protein
MANEMSDAEILSHMTTYDPPPPGFDPLTASHHLLRKHGYPHRPDPNKEPRLHKLWNETVARPLKMIKAELTVDRSIVWRRPLRTPPGSYGAEVQWAGAEVDISTLGYPPTELANSVYGQWIVPTVTPPNPDNGFAVSVWVGLGGNARIGSKQLVQAGTDARSSSNGVVYRAWTQWWQQQQQPPSTAVTVPNFPVAPGDRVGFLVTSQAESAFVSMLNYSTNQATSAGMAPPGANYDGSSAEWIVEGNGSLLADFYSVYFGQCVGGTKDHDFDLSSATIDSIVSSDGVTILATAYIISPSALVVAWENAGP